MKTKLIVSLSHRDHLAWSAIAEIPEELARLLTDAELKTVGELCAAAVVAVLKKETPSLPVERELVENKPRKKSR